MQVDEVTLARYRQQAPALLDAVEPASESPWIMRKDAATGYCVKYEGGWCGIHKQYGDSFLGDACYFYPRSTRLLGMQPVMTAALSCPEIARLALFDSTPFAFGETAIGRLPESLKNYLPDGMTAEDALAIHTAFLQATEEDADAEIILARLMSVNHSIERIDKKSWAQAVPFYLKHADTRLPAAEPHPTDPFNLLHALSGLIVATKKPMSERLAQTVSEMEQALAVTLDWNHVLIHTSDASANAYQLLRSRWQQEKRHYQPILKRYVQMQLSLALYPFSGLGHTLVDRMTIIGVRLATVRLAIMAACSKHDTVMPKDTIVRIVQSLSRFMDHLGDSKFSLSIYKETGWVKENRLRGLLE